MPKKQYRYLWLSLIVIVLDVITKAYVKTKLIYGMSVAILPFLSFTLLYNRGAAFSFLNYSSHWQQWLFSLLAIVISAFLVAWLLRVGKRRRCFSLGCALVIGGALGNLISRFYYGYVVDFIVLHAGQYAWPAFNVADAAITIGVVLILIDGLLLNR